MSAPPRTGRLSNTEKRQIDALVEEGTLRPDEIAERLGRSEAAVLRYLEADEEKPAATMERANMKARRRASRGGKRPRALKKPEPTGPTAAPPPLFAPPEPASRIRLELSVTPAELAEVLALVGACGPGPQAEALLRRYPPTRAGGPNG